jgi:DNA-binding NarL/FixJ family response regulator
MFRSIGNQWGVVSALIDLGQLALTQGRPAVALPHLQAALRGALEIEALPQIVTILATCAPLIRRMGETAWADALDQLLASASMSPAPYQTHIRRLLMLVDHTGALQARTATAGQDAHKSEAAQPRARVARPFASVNPAGLTAREMDVLRLVAHGLTDAQVATRLVLSPRTVSTHLSSIYGKLQVNSRSAATRFAIEQGIVD